MAENGHSLATLGMLDSGASATLVTRSVTQKLGVHETPGLISVNTMLAKGQDQNVKVFGCNLSPVGVADPKIPVRRAHTVNELHIDARYRPNTLDLSEWSHLEKLDLSTDVEEDSASMLIGEDVPWAHAVLKSCYGDEQNSQQSGLR